MSNGVLKSASPPPEPKKLSRFAQIKPFLAPLLISVILVVGDLNFHMLQDYKYTGLAIASSIVLEIILSYVATGRFPHLASAYITGISVGILVQTPSWWPFVLCSLLSISSKYALRVKGRHLWNPSNLGMSVMLFLAVIAPLSDQLGNALWPSLVILSLGTVILFTLGRLHISLTYAAAYIALIFVRGLFVENVWYIEMALLTVPSYQLFMIFMITDPKTTTRTWQRQCAVAVLVAIVESLLRLNRETHAPYYALFIVAPLTNLLEIWWESGKSSKSAPTAVEPVAASQATRA